MSDIGVCSSHRIAWPTVPECREQGVKLVRTVCHDVQELAGACESFNGTEIEVCALIEGQTNGFGNPFVDGDWSGVEQVTRDVVTIPAVKYVECGNELDLWKVPVWLAAQLAIRMGAIVANAGRRPILTSVVSAEWQDYAQRLAMLLPADLYNLFWANCHPYGRRAKGFPSWFGWGADGWEAECAYALARTKDLTGLPTVATESGIKLGDANHDNNDVPDIEDENAQAIFVGNWVQSFLEMPKADYPFACYFAWHDLIGQSGEQGEWAFGLRRTDWSPRPSAFAMQAALGGLAPSPTPVPPEPSPSPSVGWIGDGLKDAIRIMGWTPIGGEVPPIGPYVNCAEGPIFWSTERQRAYRINRNGKWKPI